MQDTAGFLKLLGQKIAQIQEENVKKDFNYRFSRFLGVENEFQAGNGGRSAPFSESTTVELW